MAVYPGENKPVRDFWAGLEKIVGKDLLLRFNRSSVSQTDASRLINDIGSVPEEVRLEMACYLIHHCSLDPEMFKNLIGAICHISQQEEPALVEAILFHRHFTEEGIPEIFKRCKDIKNSQLKSTIESLGVGASVKDLEFGVQAVIEAQGLGKPFEPPYELKVRLPLSRQKRQ